MLRKSGMEGNAMKDNEGTMEEQKGINMKAGNADVEKKQKITEIVNKTEEELLSQLMKKTIWKGILKR